MFKVEEFHDYDLDGKDMFPEEVEHAVEILRAGEVTYTVHSGAEFEEITERDITSPQEAAYYTLMARGVQPGDTWGEQREVFIALGKAVALKVPRWRNLHPVKPLSTPQLFDYERSYRKAA